MANEAESSRVRPFDDPDKGTKLDRLNTRSPGLTYTQESAASKGEQQRAREQEKLTRPRKTREQGHVQKPPGATPETSSDARLLPIVLRHSG